MRKLSTRLTNIARLVPGCDVLADVGSDHGLLAFSLLTERPELFAVVTDISPKSLSKARRVLAPFAERVRFFVADGLLFGEEICAVRPVVVLAGMGGHLIVRILSDAMGSEFSKKAEFILQPNTDPEAVRAFLCGYGLAINAEECVFESGHYYQIIRAAKGDAAPLTPDELMYGPMLLGSCHPVILDYIAHRIKSIDRILESIPGDNDVKASLISERFHAADLLSKLGGKERLSRVQ